MSDSTPPPNLPEERPAVDSSQVQIIGEGIPQQRGGCFWGLAGAGGCAVVILLIFLIPVLLGLTTFNALLNTIVGIFNPAASPATATVITTRTLLTGIQPLGQLVSISTQLAKADIAIGVQQGALNTCGFSARHVAQGAVEAGIDLTQIDENAISYNALTNTYTIQMPAPQLTSCRIDFIRQYDRSFTTCAVDWDEARLLANYKALVDFREDAIEGGILNRARQEARLVIGNFVKLLTNANVELVFSEVSSSPAPQSCVPEIPQGWTFNEQTQQWQKP